MERSTCSVWTYMPLTPPPASHYTPGRVAVRGRAAGCDWKEALGIEPLSFSAHLLFFGRQEVIGYRYCLGITGGEPLLLRIMTTIEKLQVSAGALGEGAVGR